MILHINNMKQLLILFFMKFNDLPSVEMMNPGVNAKNRAAGVATLAEVMSGIVKFIIYNWLRFF